MCYFSTAGEDYVTVLLLLKGRVCVRSKTQAEVCDFLIEKKVSPGYTSSSEGCRHVVLNDDSSEQKREGISWDLVSMGFMFTRIWLLMLVSATGREGAAGCASSRTRCGYTA